MSFGSPFELLHPRSAGRTLAQARLAPGMSTVNPLNLNGNEVRQNVQSRLAELSSLLPSIVFQVDEKPRKSNMKDSRGPFWGSEPKTGMTSGNF